MRIAKEKPSQESFLMTSVRNRVMVSTPIKLRERRKTYSKKPSSTMNNSSVSKQTRTRTRGRMEANLL